MRPITKQEVNQIKLFGADAIKGTSTVGITLRYFHASPAVDVQWTEGPYECEITTDNFATVEKVGVVAGGSYVLVSRGTIKFPWRYFDGTEPFIIKRAPSSLWSYSDVMGEQFTINPIHSGGGVLAEGVNVVGGISDWDVVSAAKGVADGVLFAVNKTETIGGASWRIERTGSIYGRQHGYFFKGEFHDVTFFDAPLEE